MKRELNFESSMLIVFLLFFVGCNLASTEKKVAQLEEVSACLLSKDLGTSRLGDILIWKHFDLLDSILIDTFRCVQNVVVLLNMDLDQKKFLEFVLHYFNQEHA